MASIEIDGVTKVYGNGFLAVDDISLAVRDGEFMVLVGPSGCGKSTLLRMIAGLEEVTAGAISIGGTDVTELAPRHRDIAMVFQSYALYPHMTIRQNLGYGLKVRKAPKEDARRRVEEVAELLGLTEMLDRKPVQLSGGQRQRVAMGRAIVREPQAFLMDEPLSNLDAKLRVGMRASLAQLHARLGVTTVYVTHDQTEAMTLGKRVAVLRDGKVEQVAEPQVLYAEPRNLFVAAFIGSPAMNLVEASIEDDAVAFGGFRLPLDRGPAPGRRRPPRRARHPPRDVRGRRTRSRGAAAGERRRRGGRGARGRDERVLPRRRCPRRRRDGRERGVRRQPDRRRRPSSSPPGSTRAHGCVARVASSSQSTPPASISSTRRAARRSCCETPFAPTPHPFRHNWY